jgi:hypothetical protein
MVRIGMHNLLISLKGRQGPSNAGQTLFILGKISAKQKRSEASGPCILLKGEGLLVAGGRLELPTLGL